MYDTFEAGLVKSGNAVQLNTPVLMIRDGDGDVVDNKAGTFGHAVMLSYTRAPTPGRWQQQGSAVQAPCGEIPRYEASSKNSHFTLVPITRLKGKLVLMTIIFAMAKMKPEGVR